MPIDPRLDPTTRENKPDFWLGYGDARQGKRLKAKQSPEFIEGYCFAITEDKRPKPLLGSRTMLVAACSGIVGVLLLVDGSALVDNPKLGGAIVLLQAFLMAALRRITKEAVK